MRSWHVGEVRSDVGEESLRQLLDASSVVGVELVVADIQRHRQAREVEQAVPVARRPAHAGHVGEVRRPEDLVFAFGREDTVGGEPVVHGRGEIVVVVRAAFQRIPSLQARAQGVDLGLVEHAASRC